MTVGLNSWAILSVLIRTLTDAEVDPGVVIVNRNWHTSPTVTLDAVLHGPITDKFPVWQSIDLNRLKRTRIIHIFFNWAGNVFDCVWFINRYKWRK